MKVAIVASEAAPFAKTGGLADVVGALPKALFRLGHEPILVMPYYRSVARLNLPLDEAARIQVPIAGQVQHGRVLEGRLPGVDCPAYFLDHAGYYDRAGLYSDNGADFPDNCARFAFLSRGAIEAVRAIGFDAQLFHLHDWQSALVGPYLRLLYGGDPVSRAGTLLTIHNLAYQGVFPGWDMDTIGIDRRHFNMREFEFWGNLSLLKAGILYADLVNTVSPSYAREIETPEFGCGMEGVLRDRDAALHGVVNGIDDSVWNPAGDPFLPATYGPDDLSGKLTAKRSLQRQCGFPARKAPLAGMVTRLASQKGIDILGTALPELFQQTPLQCVVLGDGDNGIRASLEQLAARFPGRLAVFFGHDERLAHRIIAGADLCLVPSRFEPCGLTQIYALKYGAVPVVRRTGGLKDTVCDCTPESLAAGKATGFHFTDATPEALTACVARALELYRDPRAWTRLMLNGMTQDWSWEASARHYLELYAEARQSRGIA